jgi:hypothetical protein
MADRLMGASEYRAKGGIGSCPNRKKNPLPAPVLLQFFHAALVRLKTNGQSEPGLDSEKLPFLGCIP